MHSAPCIILYILVTFRNFANAPDKRTLMWKPRLSVRLSGFSEFRDRSLYETSNDCEFRKNWFIAKRDLLKVHNFRIS
jgi:hypothetical protein